MSHVDVVTYACVSSELTYVTSGEVKVSSMSQVEVVTYVCVSSELTYVTSGVVKFCMCHA